MSKMSLSALEYSGRQNGRHGESLSHNLDLLKKGGYSTSEMTTWSHAFKKGREERSNKLDACVAAASSLERRADALCGRMDGQGGDDVAKAIKATGRLLSGGTVPANANAGKGYQQRYPPTNRR